MELTPIYSALKEYLKKDYLRLHMPGHIGGRGIEAEELREFAKIDLTEIPGMDDFHMPHGVIESSKKLLSEAFGASESFFLVNGASSGIHCMIMALCQDSDKIIVPRNAHRSFFGAMVLSGAMPIYLPLEFEKETGLAITVKSDSVLEIIEDNLGAKAVCITSPNFYGSTIHLEPISQCLKQVKIPFLVDEAHGSHFPFHPAYPKPALKEGADAVVNGFHKSLAVINQGAALHLGADFPAKDKLVLYHSLLSTTSPSYPLLASIELARCFMEQRGEEYLEKALQLSIKYKREINQIYGFYLLDEKILKIPGVATIDPLKLAIYISDLSINGYEIAAILREEYKIQVELEDYNIILAMFSFLHEEEDWRRLYFALEEISQKYQDGGKRKIKVEVPPSTYVQISPRMAVQAQKRTLPLKQCKDMLAGEILAVYPPGVPCLLPGELITQEIIDYIEYLKKTGAYVQGAEDKELNSLKVIELANY